MLQHNITCREASPRFALTGEPIDLLKFNDWVNKQASISFQPTELITQRVNASVVAVDAALQKKQEIYGVTTGFGAMSNQRVDCSEAVALQNNLLSFLASGAGPQIESQHTRGAMLLRANVLLQGKSGARMELIERLIEFLSAEAVPVVRQHGSIGASGDLIPLATIARAVTGQPKARVTLKGEVLDSQACLKQLNLQPIQLKAKEGLAMVNGTSFSSAIAANATIAARNSLGLYFVIQSMLMRALQVNLEPFDSFVHASKPHPGQVWSAETNRNLFNEDAAQIDDGGRSGSLQDRYALRCAPQYSGSIVETIARVRRVVETEMNAVSDNPLIDPQTGQFYQSGNFLGQYIGVAMDDLRRSIGLMAKHLDVQIASLVTPEFSGGLSPSLRGNNQQNCNMGLKGLQICGNSIMPLLTYQGNPLVEHFPTHAEQFNQNINGLSWGAANLAWNSSTLFQQYLAVATIFAIQALDLRAKSTLDHFDGSKFLGKTNRDFYSAVCGVLNTKADPDLPLLFDDQDRWLEDDIESLAKDIAEQGQLIQAIEPLINSFDQFCETSR